MGTKVLWGARGLEGVGGGGAEGELKGGGLLFVYKIQCRAWNYLPPQCALGYVSA